MILIILFWQNATFLFRKKVDESEEKDGMMTSAICQETFTSKSIETTFQTAKFWK